MLIIDTRNVNSSPKLRVAGVLKKITIIRQRTKKMMEKTVNTSQDLYMAEGIGTYFQILQQAAF
ncbi:MAG: hypothetical protein GT597_08390 [Bacteroidales bacterium]|jgi:hypothetical protein|nr:hypothetical protein [Bacteroidales bacterium]